jgi:CheY-like chemotaxis protein
MMYSAAILDQRIQDPALKRPIDIIRRQAERMIRIVDDLLDVSRVTQGKISLQRERVSIATLLSHAAEATRLRFEARRHTLTLHPLEPTLTVLGDPVRLGQVIENLLINAAKYTPEGGRVDVVTTVEDGRVAIAVKDTGIGIASDMLARVFDLFAQADTSLDRTEGGLGIGLTLADRLTRLHGGDVQAFSTGVGHGSTFIVRLPLLSAAAHVAPQAPAEAPRVLRRVLVVDDNVDSADTLEMLIKMDGHTVRVAHDGFSAVDVAGEFQPDIVLLDLGLPGKDGYTVIKDLRALPATATATIVATTGYGRDEDRVRCLAAGFDDHMTKPVDLEQLQRVLAAGAA